MHSEMLSIGDRVRYSNASGTEFFDAKVVAFEVWVPAVARHLKLPESENAVRWERILSATHGSEVIVFVDSVEGPDRSRWGYGTQIRQI